MALTWLNNTLSKATAPQKTLTEILSKNLGGWEKARDHSKVHASDITKPDFCPRRLALLHLTGKSKKDMYVPAALRATFDVGDTTSDLVREKWLGDASHGFWRCETCNKQAPFGTKPQYNCKDHPSRWKYEEPRFGSPEYDVSGGIDVCTDLGAPKLFVTELKVVNPTDFEKLVAPLAEHRIRTNLYMKLVDDSDSPLRDRFNLKQAKVLYVSRAHGKKSDINGEILPFKEFDVERNDESLQPYLDKAKQVKVFKSTGVLPGGICATIKDTHAKTCTVCTECFSGEYPQGQKVSA
jgi:hypothetical protein